jgi:hypothetical protein
LAGPPPHLALKLQVRNSHRCFWSQLQRAAAVGITLPVLAAGHFRAAKAVHEHRARPAVARRPLAVH